MLSILVLSTKLKCNQVIHSCTWSIKHFLLMYWVYFLLNSQSALIIGQMAWLGFFSYHLKPRRRDTNQCHVSRVASTRNLLKDALPTEQPRRCRFYAYLVLGRTQPRFVCFSSEIRIRADRSRLLPVVRPRLEKHPSRSPGSGDHPDLHQRHADENPAGNFAAQRIEKFQVSSKLLAIFYKALAHWHGSGRSALDEFNIN